MLIQMHKAPHCCISMEWLRRGTLSNKKRVYFFALLFALYYMFMLLLRAVLLCIPLSLIAAFLSAQRKATFQFSFCIFVFNCCSMICLLLRACCMQMWCDDVALFCVRVSRPRTRFRMPLLVAYLPLPNGSGGK